MTHSFDDMIGSSFSKMAYHQSIWTAANPAVWGSIGHQRGRKSLFYAHHWFVGLSSLQFIEMANRKQS